MDIDVLQWLQAVREDSGPVVQGIFSFLGSNAALVVLLILPCLAYWCLDKRRGTMGIIAYGLGAFCNQLIKNTACVYRPWIRDHRVMPDESAIEAATGYSFPSGHTQGTASVVGGLAWAWRDRRWPVVAAVLFTLLIAFSRLFLGVHAPQDVLAGLLVGAASVYAAERLLAWVDGGYGRDARVIAAAVLATIVFMAFVTLKPYPLDYAGGELLVDPDEMLVDCSKTAGSFLGAFLGWFVERRFVRFETEGLNVRQMALRMAVGFSILLVFQFAIGKAVVELTDEHFGQFVRYFMTFFVAVALVPTAFPRLDRLASRRRA